MSSDIKGRSLELFFIDGKPDGMLTAVVPFQWTGHVLMTSRNQISEALKRKETKRTGVYILLGENDDGPLAYIGEGEEIRDRLRSHAQTKDWWTSAVMITSSDNDLNKAHVKYLESRLVETARDVNKIALENGNTPPRPSLTEAAQANMEGFLENIFLVLPVLKIDYFLKSTRPQVLDAQDSREAVAAPIFELKTPKHKIEATAKLEEGEFVVQKGSKARTHWVGDTSKKSSYAKLFAELVQQDILVEEGDFRIFVENYAFNSTSAAGAVINGRSTAGPIAWKLKGANKTYKQWETERLEK